MKPHLVFALTAAALFAATCTSSAPRDEDGGLPPSPSDADLLVLTFTAGDRAEAVARFGEETRRPFVGSHCWKEPAAEDGTVAMRCVDTFSPTAADLKPVLQVPQGTELSAEGTAKHLQCFLGSLQDLHTRVQTRISKIEMSDRRAVLDQDPGKYALECFASWPQGSRVPFTFGIEILPPGL